MHASSSVRPTVLIADDDDCARLLLAEVAELAGLEAVAVGDGEAAIRAGTQSTLAAALLDVEMPGADGYAVCRALRAMPGNESLPIVIITGHGDAESVERAYEAGATDFIAKPVDWALLPQRLRYLMRNADAVRSIERRQAEREREQAGARQPSCTDGLTGLPSRQAFVEEVDAVLSTIDLANEQLAVLYLDLDDFRRINDTYGHDVGDELLKSFAGLLEEAVQRCAPDDRTRAIARFGGDEFVVALRHERAREQAVALAGWLNARLAEPLRWAAHEFFVAASVGIALMPEHGRDAATLIKHADAAMHSAKAHGDKGPTVYAPTLGELAREQLAIDAHLRRAVRDEMFELSFQPKYHLADNSMAGAEVLMRWTHPDLGVIPPDRFVPLAEQSGLILDLGAWLARAACRQLREWLDRGLATQLAINVSGTEFLYGDPVRTVADACADSAIDPSLLEIEITESVLVSDSTQVQKHLRDLRQLGCRISLDDFGTGYSSLAYLKRFPPDCIKIDRLFVRQIHRNRDDAAIFEAIQSLARHFGLTLAAEGVEEPAQLHWLRERGCDLGQGFLLGRPMPAHQLEKRLVAEAAQLRLRRRTGNATAGRQGPQVLRPVAAVSPIPASAAG